MGIATPDTSNESQNADLDDSTGPSQDKEKPESTREAQTEYEFTSTDIETNIDDILSRQAFNYITTSDTEYNANISSDLWHPE